MAYKLLVMGFRGSPVRAERHSALEDPYVLRETSEDRRRRPEFNPAVPIWDKVYSLRALDALGEFPCFGGVHDVAPRRWPRGAQNDLGRRTGFLPISKKLGMAALPLLES